MNALRTDPLFILAVLAILVALSEWLVRRTALRHLGSALVVILLGALVANAGLIPTASTEQAPVPVYDAILGTVAPLAIFWLLLAVNLRDLLRAGLPLILLFVIGAAGTALGVVLGMRVVDAGATIGPLAAPLAGMFAGTYIGGSINFNAVALHYGVMREGGLYGGTVAVDNVITTVWIAATLAIPRLLRRRWRRRPHEATRAAAPIVELEAERERLDPLQLAAVLALGAAALLAAGLLARATAALGVPVPAILLLTVLALLLAQFPAVARLPGPRLLGMLGVYLFLAVIGAFCDVRALAALGSTGIVLLVVAAVTVLVHGVVTYGAAWLLRVDVDGASVTSQACVGGATSALALAKSLGREDLLLPAILLGSLGTALGTFVGFAVVPLVR